MKTSEKMKMYMRQFEGCKLTAYKDAAGVLTIGYGHTGSDVSVDQKITAQKAIELFNSDLGRFETGVANLTKSVKITQSQFDALVSFSFNVGLFALKGSSLLYILLKNPNNPELRNEFLRWDKSCGRVVAGLARRRKFEADFYFGKYD
jgi:lysozyme